MNISITKTHKTPAMRWALAGLALSMLLSSLGTSIANVALPTLASVFDAELHAVKWVVTAYLLTVTAAVVGVGRLGDRIGRRRLLRAGLLMFTAASLASGLAPTLGLLIAARAAQGLGAAVMMSLTIAFVRDIMPEASTGSAMGMLGTTSAIGTALGPSLGGALIHGFGWRAVFLSTAPLGLLAALLVHRHLPLDQATPSTKPSPWLGLALLRDRALSTSLAASLLVSTVLMATLVVGPFYLSLALALDPGATGLVMSIGPIVAALTGVPAGRFVDRFGTYRMTLLGLAAIAAGSVMLFAIPETFGIPGYVAPIVVITAGYAVFQTANNTAVMQGVSASERGVVSGLLNLSRNLGLITGVSAMGAVFALGSGGSRITSAPPEAIAAGMRITFAVAAVLIALAVATVVAGSAHCRRARTRV